MEGLRLDHLDRLISAYQKFRNFVCGRVMSIVVAF